MLEKGIDMVQGPTLAAVLAKAGGEIALELVTAVTLPDDPPCLLRGKLGTRKRVAWAEPLDLDDIKAVGRACDCTVNDVLMVAAAGALREYMIERGENPDGLTLRATVPVNLRPLEHIRKLGNYFGLVFLDLPVGEGQPGPPPGAGFGMHGRLEVFKASRCFIWTLCRNRNGDFAGAGSRAGAVQP